MSQPQSYATHARYLPLYHYFGFPVLLANFIIALVSVVRVPAPARIWWVVVSAALVAVAYTARTMALTVQNRVIRLEERLRMARVLPPDLQAAGAALSTGQLIGLRFAPDEELPGLVRRIAAGELTDRKAIKQAIVSWKPDDLRA